MRTISLEQVATAIELNGYPLTQKVFFRSHPDKDVSCKNDQDVMRLGPGRLESACALGQAALNLGVGTHSLAQALGSSSTLYILAHVIADMNDHLKTPKAIARWIRKEYKDLLNEELELDEIDWGAIFDNYQGRKV